MYISSNFERLFIRYKAEVFPSGDSIQSFCGQNKVPYNLFIKWYKDTHHRVVPVKVEGLPPSTPDAVSNSTGDVSSKSSLRILVDIRMSNGMHIRQGNLSYESLRKLVGKLEEFGPN